MSTKNTTDIAFHNSRGKVGHVDHSTTSDNATKNTRDHALSWDDTVTHEDERTLDGGGEIGASDAPQLYDKDTRDWLVKRCVHCAGVGLLRGWKNRLGLFSTSAGDVLVHMQCWQVWYDVLIDNALDGKCQVCGEPGAPGNPLGIYPRGSVVGVAGHVGCFLTWLNQNPKTEIMRSTGDDPLQCGRGRLRENNQRTS